MHERIPHGSLSSAPGAPNPGAGRPVQRVLFFGKNMSRSRCTGALVDALEGRGLDVKWRNMATLRRWLGKDGAQRWAARMFRAYRPDLVFVFCRDLPGALLQEFAKHADVVLWFEEALEDPDHSLIDYMALADLVCVSNPGHLEELHRRGVDNIAFLMSGFSPRFHSPQPRRVPQRDLVFIGGPGKQGQRASFLAELSRSYDTEIYGRTLEWEPWVRRYPNLRVRKSVGNAGVSRLCATSRIVLGLNFNRLNHDPLYFSNRVFLTLACRGFHLMHYVPGLESMFGNGEHLAWYDGLDDCIEKVGYYLKANDERERIAEAGYERVVEAHQYYHRVERLLEILAHEKVSRSRPAILRPVAASG